MTLPPKEQFWFLHPGRSPHVLMMPFYFHEVMLMASWQPAPAAARGLGGAGTKSQLQGLIFMQGLPGSHPEAVTGDLHGALLPRGWAAFRSEAAAASPELSCALGVLPSPAFGLIFHPGASPSLARAPLAWLYSVGLLSKQLKLPFVHLFNGSPPHITLVRDRIHWLAEPPSWKPSSFWLAGSQPSISVIRALCRAHGCFCLSAPTGGLENTGFLAELLFGLKKKKKKSVNSTLLGSVLFQ